MQNVYPWYFKIAKFQVFHHFAKSGYAPQNYVTNALRGHKNIAIGIKKELHILSKYSYNLFPAYIFFLLYPLLFCFMMKGYHS